MRISEYITNKVGRMRARRHATQEDMAKQVGVSRQTIIALERGHYTPSVLLAIKVARYFGTTVDDVFSVHREK